MHFSLYFQLSQISLILLSVSPCSVANEAIEDSREAFPEDFKDFLKGLSLMTQRCHEADATTTRISTFGTMRPEVLLSSQKAALRDILMMKLVSYYEDKYRVSHHMTTGPPETLEPITLQTEARIIPERNNPDGELQPLHTISRSYDDTREKYPSDVAGVVVI